MTVTGNTSRQALRYQVDEKPSAALSLGLGVQLTILILGGIVLTPAIIVRAADGSEDYLSWAVFAAVAISGLTTVLQAIRVGRIGSGYVLAMGTSGSFIAISVAALSKGGPGMLATLVAVSALFQFILSARLSLLRRILTPTVAGTVIMLIPVTVMPIIFDMLEENPVAAGAAAPISASVTLLIIMGITLFSTGILRLWAPVIGVVIGSAIAGFYGMFDIARVVEARWLGLPHGTWPGLEFSFGPVFWALLPGFIFVTLVGAVETVGDSVAIQRASWRKPRSVDYRTVQGAVTTDGIGNLLSGLAATVPNTTYSTSVAITELTGVASRQIGVVLGFIVMSIAFFPKLIALVVAIPGPVAAAYLTALLAMLFVLGMKIVVQDGLNYRKALIVGISFWLGVGFQNGLIFSDHLPDFARHLLENGMTAGGIVAMMLTLAMEAHAPHRKRLQVPFDVSALPRISQFLAEFASSNDFSKEVAYRLDAVAEETMLALLAQSGKSETLAVSEVRRSMLGLRPAAAYDPEERAIETIQRQNLLLTAHREANTAVLEFIAGPGEENLQDRITLLGERAEESYPERDISLRLLRHLASSVHHQQYFDTDIVTVIVDCQASSSAV